MGVTSITVCLKITGYLRPAPYKGEAGGFITWAGLRYPVTF
jgi:hypothetical protein